LPLVHAAALRQPQNRQATRPRKGLVPRCAQVAGTMPCGPRRTTRATTQLASMREPDGPQARSISPASYGATKMPSGRRANSRTSLVLRNKTLLYVSGRRIMLFRPDLIPKQIHAQTIQRCTRQDERHHQRNVGHVEISPPKGSVPAWLWRGC
jgi:hypothetical protein